MINADVTIRPLHEMPEVAPTLASWFKHEWPEFFSGQSENDIALQFFTPGLSDGTFPLILVAFTRGMVCGTIALRVRDLTTHEHLSPWAGGLYVEPQHRRRGIGAGLVQAITVEAQRRTFSHLYAGTGSAAGLLLRLGWESLENFVYQGEPITLFRKSLAA